jgi:hypothetical protein
MLQRIVRAVTFDMKFYGEAKADASLNREGLIIVIVVAILTGIGALSGGIGALLLMLIMSVVGYYLISYFVTIVSRNFFGGTGTQDQVQRVIAYSWAPRALGLLGFIPCVGWVLSLAATIWSLAVAVVAVREVHAFDTTKAIITVVAGGVIVAVLTGLVGLIFGIGWMGLGAL